jgi:hypothetical protein
VCGYMRVTVASPQVLSPEYIRNDSGWVAGTAAAKGEAESRAPDQGTAGRAEHRAVPGATTAHRAACHLPHVLMHITTRLLGAAMPLGLEAATHPLRARAPLAKPKPVDNLPQKRRASEKKKTGGGRRDGHSVHAQAKQYKSL